MPVFAYTGVNAAGKTIRAEVEAETLRTARSKLRREGILPANVYGRGLDSVAVQLPRREAETILAANGLNSLIEIAVEGESEQRPVVIRKVQRHALSREILHIDFYQVDLTRPIQAQVPVTLVGEAPAILRPGMEGVGKIHVGERRLIWIWTHKIVYWIRMFSWSWWP